MAAENLPFSQQFALAQCDAYFNKDGVVGKIFVVFSPKQSSSSFAYHNMQPFV